MEKNTEEDIGHSDETVIFSVFTEGIRILCANQFLYTVASSLQKNSSDIFVSLPVVAFVSGVSSAGVSRTYFIHRCSNVIRF